MDLLPFPWQFSHKNRSRFISCLCFHFSLFHHCRIEFQWPPQWKPGFAAQQWYWISLHHLLLSAYELTEPKGLMVQVWQTVNLLLWLLVFPLSARTTMLLKLWCRKENNRTLKPFTYLCSEGWPTIHSLSPAIMGTEGESARVLNRDF